MRPADRFDGSAGVSARSARLVHMVAMLLAAAMFVAAAPQKSPADMFGPLFARVQLEGLFPDSKTFADAVPKSDPAAIMAAYEQQKPGSREKLLAFVTRYFSLPAEASGPPLPRIGIRQHIASLWPMLTRPPLAPAPHSSALPLDHIYAVPGGRFREVYYWDSYFTMLGLVRDGRRDAAQGLVDNFADLIARHGHVPNGARTYYLSRSQPPFFYLMVGLLSADPAAAYARYLPALKREHQFWMRGADALRPGAESERVVAMPDGSVLNRYWDDKDTPRDESYREDVEASHLVRRPVSELYRDIRAAAESGWDFSSRWFADGRSLQTIHTKDIVPPDLNSLLYGLERAISQGCARQDDRSCAGAYRKKSERRRAAINLYLWDAGASAYLDFDRRQGRSTGRLSAATLYPLFTGVADRRRAKLVASTVERQLVRSGGLVTTAVETGQQWDAPNGWAPLQWIAVAGLRGYGEDALARTIAGRWLGTVCRVYLETGKLLEKYDVIKSRPGGGGEYPLQDGFGWTNGVTVALLGLYPDIAAANGDCPDANAPTKSNPIVGEANP